MISAKRISAPTAPVSQNSSENLAGKIVDILGQSRGRRATRHQISNGGAGVSAVDGIAHRTLIAGISVEVGIEIGEYRGFCCWV